MGRSDNYLEWVEKIKLYTDHLGLTYRELKSAGFVLARISDTMKCEGKIPFRRGLNDLRTHGRRKNDR